MLNKQLSHSGSQPTMAHPVLDHFELNFILRHPCDAFHQGLFVAPLSLLISFFQLDITFPKRENESFPQRARVELILLAPARCDTKPETMENLTLNGVESQRHGWISFTKRVKTPRMPGYLTIFKGLQSSYFSVSY